MSNTHDFVIADANGATFRADLNSALADIQTSNAGTSEPSTKVAGKLWVDDTNNRIKLRNGANNSWVDLGASNATDMGHATAASPTFSGTVTSAGDVVCSGTGSLQLPSGTTGERPTGVNGDVRYNSTLNQIEGYTGTWERLGGVPAGAVSAYAGSSVPTGWFECNGAAISRSAYATLFTAISTTYGTGNGSSTFNLPELRGEFIRGWDNSRGVDSGRSLGSHQDDQVKAHTHTYTAATVYKNLDIGSDPSRCTDTLVSQNTGSTGGSENLVRNFALMYIIKY